MCVVESSSWAASYLSMVAYVAMTTAHGEAITARSRLRPDCFEEAGSFHVQVE